MRLTSLPPGIDPTSDRTHDRSAWQRVEPEAAPSVGAPIPIASLKRGTSGTLTWRSAPPLGGDRLRPLVGHELLAPSLLLGAARTRLLAELRSHCHGLLDGRPLTDFLKPTLQV